jgi:LL-diaminopimelate aminotransferase
MPQSEIKPIIINPANRIASFKPYFFAALNHKLAMLRERGVDIIRLDMGSPDLPPADFIVDALVKSAKRSDTHGYSAAGGTVNFREAVSKYYAERFNVKLNPKTEVLGLIGSKEGLFTLSQVLLNPGDGALVPDPGYPVYSASTLIAGAQVYPLPLLSEANFLPDLDAIPEDIAKKSKILWLNYPNNPTGAIAPLSFLEKAVQFALKNNIIIAFDAPYTDVCFDGYKAPSILQIDGAKNVVVEFNSLSKTYNMAGWRVGMAVGNPQVIQYLSTYKSQMDSSQFSAILDAGVAALTQDQSWIEERNDIYQHRRDIVVKAFKQMGFHLTPPPAAIYTWAGLPDGYSDDIGFCDRLLEETGVSMTPGSVYGIYGKGYLRVSLGTATHQIQEAMTRLMKWLK